jgi:hypothetical protein
MKESSKKRAKRLGDLLVERGFATSYIIDFKTGVGRFEWTDAGRVLHGQLRVLFGVPPLSPSEVSGEDVMALVSMILFTDPV